MSGNKVHMLSARHANAARWARQKEKTNKKTGFAELLLKMVREYRQQKKDAGFHSNGHNRDNAPNPRGHPHMSK